MGYTGKYFYHRYRAVFFLFKVPRELHWRSKRTDQNLIFKGLRSGDCKPYASLEFLLPQTSPSRPWRCDMWHYFADGTSPEGISAFSKVKMYWLMHPHTIIPTTMFHHRLDTIFFQVLANNSSDINSTITHVQKKSWLITIKMTPEHWCAVQFLWVLANSRCAFLWQEPSRPRSVLWWKQRSALRAPFASQL